MPNLAPNQSESRRNTSAFIRPGKIVRDNYFETVKPSGRVKNFYIITFFCFFCFRLLMVAITIFLCYMNTLVISIKSYIFFSPSLLILGVEHLIKSLPRTASFFTCICNVRLQVAPSLFAAPALSEMPVSHGGQGCDSGGTVV